MHLSGGWLTCWQLSWNSVMAILAFWFWPLVQAPTNHTCSWHLCVPGHFRDGPAAFAIASPMAGRVSSRKASSRTSMQRCCFSICNTSTLLVTTWMLATKKRCPTCKSGRWKPLFQERIGMGEKWRLGNWDHIFYKLNLQNCRVFKLQLVSLLSPFRSSCRRKEWESGG